MTPNIPWYPLKFEPIYQYRIWGGRRLSRHLSAPLPGDDEPIGEAWLLSDRDDHPSRVVDGPFKGWTLQQLLKESPESVLGKLASRFRRFPLLLKFLDARDLLSVQVHPSDEQTEYLPAGEQGKTEAWVVLEAGAKSRVYAGLKEGVSRDDLIQALANKSVADCLASFSPRAGDAVFLPAGIVHSLGDLVVFEVQENSDVTFRLYDWDHIDAKTHKPRDLQVDQAMACLDFAQTNVGPVTPVIETKAPGLRERIFNCKHFVLWRLRGELPFNVGAVGLPRILVCLDGEGLLAYHGGVYTVNQGDVLLLPAVLGVCSFQPQGTVGLLEIALPEAMERKGEIPK